MDTRTGELYGDEKALKAALRRDPTIADHLVAIEGPPELVERVSRAVRARNQVDPARARRKAQQKASRKRNRP